jgi:HSP20 family protein
MTKDFIQLMHGLFMPKTERLAGGPWHPAVDVYRTPSGWMLKFDLAGVNPDEISVSLRGRFLTVSGCRRDCTTEEGCRHYLMEISYSRFERTIELPCCLEPARIATDYRDGMLLVRIETEAKS